jgi:zinc transport system substrate-binding protein
VQELFGGAAMKYAPLFFAAALACFCMCGNNRPAAQGTPLTVFVSIVPQKYFVDRISGGLVNCLVMVPPGADPHTFEPHPAQMSLLSTAKAYFAIGLEFENPWLPKFAAVSRAMRIVHTDSAVAKIPSEDADEQTPSGGQGLDPHIWLSPALVKQQVRTIAAALAKIDTAHAAAYVRNRDALLAGIDSLDLRLRALFPCDSAASHKARRAFLVYHPTWGYFAKDYCLRQVSIEAEGKEPSPRMMKRIIDTARFYRIHTVFVQPEFSRKSAEVIARELGAGVLDADALAYDWTNNLLNVAGKLAEQ